MRKIFFILCTVLLLSFFLAGDVVWADSGDTLDDAVKHIKKMVDAENSADEIASEVVKIVDDRVVNINSWERFTDWRNVLAILPWVDNPKEEEFDKFRAQGLPEHDVTAEWLWKSQYGQCEESACLTYYILKKAGVKGNVRILSTTADVSLLSTGGHSFVVWGIKDGADPNNPKTWGSDARVVDGWAGEILTAEKAYDDYSSGGETITERTKKYDKNAAVWKVTEKREIEFGECFIATAAYGTSAAEEIDIMRDFRDEVLVPNAIGRGLVNLYYRVSPPLACFIYRHETLRMFVREIVIDPVVKILEISQDIWKGEKGYSDRFE